MSSKISIVKEKSTPSYSAYLRSDGIVHFELKDIKDYTIEIVNSQTETLKEFGGGKQLSILMTFVSYNSPNDETMKYASKKENIRFAKAIAVVVDSLSMRLGVNFFLTFFRPELPTQLFNSKDTAIEWLRKKNEELK